MDDAEQADEPRVGDGAAVGGDGGEDRVGEAVGRGRSVAAVVPGGHRRLLVVVQVGGDLARVDEREADAGAVELVPQRLAERSLRRLRRAVDGGVGEGAHRRAGGDDHDVAAAGGDHRLQRRAHGPDGAEPVDRGHLLDPLGRQRAERAVVGDAGVGDDQLQPAGLAHEALDRLGDRRARGDVARQRQMAGAGQLARERLQRVGRAGRQAERRAARGERPRERLADPARRARHQRTCARTDLHAASLTH